MRRPPPYRPTTQFQLDMPLSGRSLGRTRKLAETLFPLARNWAGRMIYYLPRGGLVVITADNITHFSNTGTSILSRHGGRVVSDHQPSEKS